MKVPESVARQVRRERRITRREDVAEQHRQEAEARVKAHEVRRRQWEAGPRIFRIMSRGWEKPFVLDFSGPDIPCTPDEFVRIAGLPVTEVAAIVAEAGEKARGEAARKLADKVLRDIDADKAGGCRRLYLSGDQSDEN